MSALYTTTVTATGGRAGRVQSDDGLLEMQLALPSSMGGTGKASNPEQMFAGGYAACFGNAVIHVARRHKAKLRDNDVTVMATVGLRDNGSGGFGLTVALDVTLAGLDQAEAETIVGEAHKVCPYSNAMRGNIDVAITVRVA